MKTILPFLLLAFILVGLPVSYFFIGWKLIVPFYLCSFVWVLYEVSKAKPCPYSEEEEFKAEKEANEQERSERISNSSLKFQFNVAR